MNCSNLVGRLTKKPDLHYNPSGVPVANFTLAVNRPFLNQQGERETDFIPIVVWRKSAENVDRYCQKGSLVGVTGRIQTRNYENNEGKRVYVTEVVAESVQFLESRNDSSVDNNEGTSNNSRRSNSNGQNNPNQRSNNYQDYKYAPADDDPFANSGRTIDIDDDSLPF